MTAPELSAEERAIVERFDAAEDLPESWAGQQRMAAGYAQARDRLADQERRQNLTGLRDEVVAGVERALLREAIADGVPEWAGLVPEEQGWLADAVLTLPEMVALLDKVRQVREAHDWQCDCTPDDPCRIAIALDGKP